MTEPHVEKALRYIDDVLTGRIPACRYVRQACQRQRDDLERWAVARWPGELPPFVFDEEAAGRACRFIELLPHVKGPKANRGELLVLEPWQCFLVTAVFGWRCTTEDGPRRFRRVYLEVPRGNAKSTLSAAVALYGLAGEGEEGAEVYSAARTKEQAKKVWTPAKLMIRKRRDLSRRLGLLAGKDVITHGRTNSTFAPMTRDHESQEGQNVYVGIIEELHVHPTRDVYDLVETATSKRPNSLLWCITTAGADTSGICFDLRGFCVRVLSGEVQAEEQFAVIYTIDEGDKERWQEEEVWRKANPNYGVEGSVDPTNIRSLAMKALVLPSARANFLRKHLDLWVGGDETWMDMEAWDAAGDATLRLDDFAGQRCWLGLDLASKVDLAALAILFERIAPGGVRHVYLFVRLYLPQAAASEARNAQYAGWVHQGFITVTPGNVLDFDVVKADILELVRRFRVVQVGFDPWQATQLSSELARSGVQMVEVAQDAKRLSEPMKEFAALTLSGRLHHDANPVMRWMVSNVVRRENPTTGTMRPVKEKSELKIDGPVAAFIGLNRLIGGEDDAPPPNPYAERGLLSLG